MTNKFKIFIVEDDSWYGEMLKYHLNHNPDYEISLFDSAHGCLEHLNEKPDVISMNYNLHDIKGDKLYKRIRKINDEIPVIVISNQEKISVAIKLLQEGVCDYIVKDDNAKDMLWNSILRIRENVSLKAELRQLKSKLASTDEIKSKIIGESKAMKNQYELIKSAAENNINVSITGETGTGKEVVAKAIHYNSERKSKQLITINMSAIPVELIESELFGHEKGAFTGAISQKIGKFEAADGGTIFMDEIAELDLNMQAKLLRVLQEREVVRIGGNKRIKFDARLISATNKNLAEEVRKGNFRKDLYYRIIGLPIKLPTLRERGGDVLLLADFFAEEFAKNNGRTSQKLTVEAKEKLMQYNYPGNVRELKAIIDLACVMSNGGDIEKDKITFHTDIVQDGVNTSMEKSLKEYIADIMAFYLKKYNGNVLLVAKKLDIGKSTIYNMIKSGDIIR